MRKRNPHSATILRDTPPAGASEVSQKFPHRISKRKRDFVSEESNRSRGVSPDADDILNTAPLVPHEYNARETKGLNLQVVANADTWYPCLSLLWFRDGHTRTRA